MPIKPSRKLQPKRSDEDSTAVMLVAKPRQARMKWSLVVLLLAIIACGNFMFRLVSWGHIHGVFNLRDIGLLMIILLLVGLVLRGAVAKKTLSNGFTVLVFCYLFFVLMQASVVSFNFKQSVFDGIVAVRHQFWYLSFFVFLIILDNEKKLTQIFNVLFVLSIILSIIGFINYSGFVLYEHKWAEGHGVRAGVTRAFFAGMDIITMGALWGVANWLSTSSARLRKGVVTVMLLVVHVLRQTRGRLIGLVAAIIFLLVYKKRFKMLLVGSLLTVMAASISGLFMEENIFYSQFESAFEDVVEEEGSWSPRLLQLELDIKVFLEHPFMGSGTSALRFQEGLSNEQANMLHALANLEDLGYTHWLKAYGVPGILWLMALYILMTRYMRDILNNPKGSLEPVGLVACGYLFFVMVSFVTLSHFMRPDRILLVCLSLAVLVRVRQFSSTKA